MSIMLNILMVKKAWHETPKIRRQGYVPDCQIIEDIEEGAKVGLASWLENRNSDRGTYIAPAYRNEAAEARLQPLPKKPRSGKGLRPLHDKEKVKAGGGKTPADTNEISKGQGLCLTDNMGRQGLFPCLPEH